MATPGAYFTIQELSTRCQYYAEEYLLIHGKPDLIVALARGGMIPAQMLAYQMKVDKVRLLDVGRDGGATTTFDDKPIIMRAPFVVEGQFDHVLIVDDICCQGKTHNWLRDHIDLLVPVNAENPYNRFVRFFFCVIRDKHIQSNALHDTDFLWRCSDDKYIWFPWDHNQVVADVTKNRTERSSEANEDDEIPF